MRRMVAGRAEPIWGGDRRIFRVIDRSATAGWIAGILCALVLQSASARASATGSYDGSLSVDGTGEQGVVTSGLIDANGAFQPQGLARHGWASTGPIREVFRRGFAAAGLPYFNPHSFRDMLVHHAMRLGLGPEELKAWSQNLGHADVLTTLTSYGQVPVQRQGELIRARATREKLANAAVAGMDTSHLIAELARRHNL